MPACLHLFGIVHLAILAAVPSLAALVAAAQRRLRLPSRVVRLTLAVLLGAVSLMYYGYLALHGQLIFPDQLPLELCDASLWLTVFCLLTLHRGVFDLTYYPVLVGASMSLLTPSLTSTAPVFLTVQFFLDHGLMVAAVLYLVWSRQLRPRPGSVARAMIFVNVFALAVGIFDQIFKTDYMFLCAKPVTVSLLDWMGPWPWYILSGEGVALLLFTLLYLPFRARATRAS